MSVEMVEQVSINTDWFARVETSFAKQEANFAKHRVWIMATSIGTVTFLFVMIGLFGE